jgi:hypothetical protein
VQSPHETGASARSQVEQRGFWRLRTLWLFLQ